MYRVGSSARSSRRGEDGRALNASGRGGPSKQALRRRWADLIRRVFELDPLLCPCGGTLRLVAFITEPRIIRKILEHLNNKANGRRAPPLSPTMPSP